MLDRQIGHRRVVLKTSIAHAKHKTEWPHSIWRAAVGRTKHETHSGVGSMRVLRLCSRGVLCAYHTYVHCVWFCFFPSGWYILQLVHFLPQST